MSIRGQNPEAWRARWRTGTCPVHGVGFADVKSADVKSAGDEQSEDEADEVSDGAASYRLQMCPREDCQVRVARFAGHDEHHASFGWVAGGDDIRAALAKAGEIAAEGVRPGKWGRVTRVSYRLEEE